METLSFKLTFNCVKGADGCACVRVRACVCVEREGRRALWLMLRLSASVLLRRVVFLGLCSAER